MNETVGMIKTLFCAAVLSVVPLFSARAADQAPPLNFHFTAVDGSNFDLANEHGKVVLIFFWATWSKPSRDDVPIVVKVLKKYRDKGFEVVGVSLDSDQETMQTYMNEYNMDWPEYFDGRGKENAAAVSMKQTELPGIWLVGKTGHVISKNANGSLDAQVEKALQAK